MAYGQYCRYAREGLGLKDVDANCMAFIIIGRRSSLDPKQIKKYRATLN